MTEKVFDKRIRDGACNTAQPPAVCEHRLKQGKKECIKKCTSPEAQRIAREIYTNNIIINDT